jgi:hypothetical protein
VAVEVVTVPVAVVVVVDTTALVVAAVDVVVAAAVEVVVVVLVPQDARTNDITMSKDSATQIAPLFMPVSFFYLITWLILCHVLLFKISFKN